MLAAAIRRNNRANLVHWAEANVREPGARVAAEPRRPRRSAVARDLVRRGLDADALHGYRVGQNVGWRRWMELAFELTSDPDELRELLDVTSRSIFTFVDETLAGITEQIERERDELTRGTHAQRLEVVSLILEGAPIGVRAGVGRLATRSTAGTPRRSCGATARTPTPARSRTPPRRSAARRARAPLTVVPSASTRWVWVAGGRAPDRALVRGALPRPAEMRVALGPTAPRDRRLPAQPPRRAGDPAADAPQRAALRLARYEDVQVVALATQDEERADEFVARTLGDFATAPAELRETARVYLRERSNATRAARVLFTHRNTVARRLTRIEQLLPAPLEGRGAASRPGARDPALARAGSNPSFASGRRRFDDGGPASLAAWPEFSSRRRFSSWRCPAPRPRNTRPSTGRAPRSRRRRPTSPSR